jgi:hypothetical protein
MVVPTSAMPSLTPAVSASFAKQIAWCESLGSPFTAELLGLMADDGAAGGVTAGLLAGWPGDPIADALPLRLTSALHALVLGGSAPELAACYPPHEVGDPARLRRAALDALVTHDAVVKRFLVSPPQTNEVGRSAALVGGFHFVAGWGGLPLRLLEIGASAGLNAIWDRYRYRLGSAAWGPEDSPVVLAPKWHGDPPALTADLRIAERAACDTAPIDIADPDACLRLRSYIWADQRERLDRLDTALSLARQDGVHVEQADAGAWVPARLAQPAEGRTAVLYHSIMWQYLPADTQRRIGEAMHDAGARSTRTAPLAWLRLEPTTPDGKPELHVTLWPGERHVRLAVARAHGNAVEWLGGDQHGAG